MVGSPDSAVGHAVGAVHRLLLASAALDDSRHHQRGLRAHGRGEGLSERQVLVRHVLRNSLIPIISLWGLDLAQVIGGGAILTESVYNLHGVGQLAADSIRRLDIIPILAIVMLTAFFVVILGALIDVLYALLDPRIRLS